ncbi:MAG: 50S ribosomal protein L31e [Candidatus Bathyarchaeia archaeon]|jgi:large subunit ribosomal protein L31e
MVNAQEEQQSVQETEELAEAIEEPETTQEVMPAEAAQEPTEAEAKIEKPKKKKKDEDVVEERIYTIPLQKALIRPPKKRAPRAMQLLKIFVTKHMKMAVTVSEDEEEEELPQLIITQEVNEKIWGRGIEKPPRKIRVRVTKDKDNNVTVHLAEA